MNTLRHSLLFLFLGCLVCAVLLPLAPRTGEAEVVHLRTGESVKGRPVRGRCDEKILVIEDYLSGATRTLKWEVVDPADRDRLLEWLGIKNKSMQAVEGHRIVIELQGGAKDVLRGLILREDDAYVWLLRGGKELKVSKSMIVGRDVEEMDPRDIWSPEQLVERYLEDLQTGGADLANLTNREKFKVGEYAEAAGDFETARKHYAALSQDPEYLLSNVASQRLERVESILKDAAALADLRQMRMALSLKAFRKVREMLVEFERNHPDVGEAIKYRLEKGKKEFAKRRSAYFQLEAKINFPKIVMRLIKKKVQEDEVELAATNAWTKKELPELAFELLSAMFNRKDDVTPDEARGFWENRPKSAWKTATYGAGTFIVEKPKIKPPKKRRSNKKKKRKKGGQSSSVPKTPKAPTRDQWWESAGTAHRQSWVMAFFVENSGLFEVSAKPKWSKCQKCAGTGLEEKRYQNGAVLKYICTRCAGAQRDKRVRFR